MEVKVLGLKRRHRTFLFAGYLVGDPDSIVQDPKGLGPVDLVNQSVLLGQFLDMIPVGELFLIGIGMGLQKYLSVLVDRNLYGFIDDGYGDPGFNTAIEVFDILGGHSNTAMRRGMHDAFRPDSGMDPIARNRQREPVFPQGVVRTGWDFFQDEFPFSLHFLLDRFGDRPGGIFKPAGYGK